VVKGKAEEGDSHAVDGMSGATITGNGIQRFLNDTYRKYYTSVFKQMRSES
jgi:Na+-transporting NADH:ubiquinone oxidoreductase subunit NqrC